MGFSRPQIKEAESGLRKKGFLTAAITQDVLFRQLTEPESVAALSAVDSAVVAKGRPELEPEPTAEPEVPEAPEAPELLARCCPTGVCQADAPAILCGRERLELYCSDGCAVAFHKSCGRRFFGRLVADELCGEDARCQTPDCDGAIYHFALCTGGTESEDGRRLRLARRKELLAGRRTVAAQKAAAEKAAAEAKAAARASKAAAEKTRKVCRGAWARVTIDQFRHLALRTFYGHTKFSMVFTNMFPVQF